MFVDTARLISQDSLCLPNNDQGSKDILFYIKCNSNVNL